jgi:hypothetical protein
LQVEGQDVRLSRPDAAALLPHDDLPGGGAHPLPPLLPLPGPPRFEPGCGELRIIKVISGSGSFVYLCIVHVCICLLVFLCFCVCVYLCICVFVCVGSPGSRRGRLLREGTGGLAGGGDDRRGPPPAQPPVYPAPAGITWPYLAVDVRAIRPVNPSCCTVLLASSVWIFVGVGGLT